MAGEPGFDRGVVAEAQSEALAGQLPRLGRPGARRVDDLEPSAEDVVDGVGAGRVREAEAPRELLEQRGLAGAQIEVAAQDQGRLAGPGDGRLGGAAHLRRRQTGARARVQVRDAEPGVEPGEGHRASLGTAAKDELSPVEQARPRPPP